MTQDPNQPKSIGELAALVVARSTIATVTEAWRTIHEDDDWRIAWETNKGKLLLVHHPSLTFSMIELTGTLIHQVTVFSTTRERELGTHEHAGHWTRVHGQRARWAIERYLGDA